MNGFIVTSLVAMLLALAGCSSQSDPENKPDPQAITTESIGHFCSMDLIEHDGPKGQIFVKGRTDPLWFSTIRQTLAYTILPDSPKGLDAIYVTDMATVKNMRQPEVESWMNARDAYYVTESKFSGGMGGEDPLPFSERKKAEEFVASHGGQILKFNEMSEDYILHYDMLAPITGGTIDDAKAGPS